MVAHLCLQGWDRSDIHHCFQLQTKHSLCCLHETQKLHEIQKRIQLEEHGKLVGKEFEVMVTGKNPRRPGELLGRTESYKVVNFPGNHLPGEFVRVKIKRFGPYSLRGIEVI